MPDFEQCVQSKKIPKATVCGRGRPRRHRLAPNPADRADQPGPKAQRLRRGCMPGTAQVVLALPASEGQTPRVESVAVAPKKAKISERRSGNMCRPVRRCRPDAATASKHWPAGGRGRPWRRRRDRRHRRWRPIRSSGRAARAFGTVADAARSPAAPRSARAIAILANNRGASGCQRFETPAGSGIAPGGISTKPLAKSRWPPILITGPGAPGRPLRRASSVDRPMPYNPSPESSLVGTEPRRSVRSGPVCFHRRARSPREPAASSTI